MPKKDPLSVAFGLRLRQVREKAGLSQEQLALRADLNRTYIGGLERAERNPTIQTASKLALALGVDLGELLSNLQEKKKVSYELPPLLSAAAVKEETLEYGSEKAAHRFIDLFCGIGGFRIGFESAGARCVWSCDWDKYARKTYNANFGEEPFGDIHEIAPAAIPRHDVLCGGFPCQPFSIAGVSKKNSLGRKHGFSDEKQGNLFFSIADIIDVHRPRAFVLENVKNLKSHDKGHTFEVIRRTLTEALGYTLYHKVIDAKSVVPQHRERIFLVGFREPRWFEFPDFDEEGPNLSAILETKVEPKYTLTDHLWTYLQNYAAKHKAAGNGFGFGLNGPNDTARTLSARYYKDGSEILIKQRKPKNPRRLTPRECARLMGYPDDFEIPVSDTQAYKQFGNSVVVPVVKKIAQSVIASLEKPADYRSELTLKG